MSLKINLLRENLQELFSAAHRRSNNHLGVVPSPLTKKIYDASCGWGRLWRWFYNIFSICKCTGLDSERRLKESLLATAKIFQEQLPIIQESTNRYISYIKEASTFTSLNESDYESDRRTITRWNDEITPFITSLQSTKNTKLRDLLQPFFQDIAFESSQKFNIDAKLQQDLYQCQQLINAESHCNKNVSSQYSKPLPIGLFLMLANNKEISPSQILDVRTWIKDNNKITAEFGPDKFHSLFQSMISLSLEPTAKATSSDIVSALGARLETQLFKNGFELLYESSPNHLKWRETLATGMELSAEDRSYKLGAEIQHKEMEEKETINRNPQIEKNKVYEIDGKPDEVLVTSINRAIPGMRKFEQIQVAPLMICPSALCLYLDPEGRFAITEKIPSLDRFEWHTISRDLKIDPRDLGVCDLILDLIKKCIDQKLTPRHLTKKHLGIDTSKRLRFLRFTVNEAFDFNKIEKFINSLFPVEHPIYTCLMVKSKLLSLPIAKQYHDIGLAALKSTDNLPAAEIPKEVIKLIAPSNDIRIINEGVMIYRKIQEIKESHFQRLVKNHPEKSKEILQSINEIAKKIDLKSEEEPWKLLFVKLTKRLEALN